MKRIISTLICCAIIFKLSGQDFLFSQIDFSPGIFNAGAVGLNPGQSVTIHTRNESTRTFPSVRNSQIFFPDRDLIQSIAVLYENQFEINSTNRIGFGIAAEADRVKLIDGRLTDIKLTLSYMKILKQTEDTQRYLSGGINFGMGKPRLDNVNRYDQMGSFNVADIDFERSEINHFSPELGAGLNFRTDLFKKNRVDIGLAFNHLNRAKMFDLKNYTERLNIRSTFYAFAELANSPHFSTKIRTMFIQQAEVTNFIFGLSEKYYPKSKKDFSIEIGANIRYELDGIDFFDSVNWVTAVCGFNYKKLTISFSKDLLGDVYGLKISDDTEIGLKYSFRN